MLSNGKICVLENEYLYVRVASVGAALLSAKSKKYGDFLLHMGDDDFSEGYVGKVIAPWVNRVKNGEYCVNNYKYNLPINDFETNSALHGLVAWQNFSIVSLTCDSVMFEYDLYPSPSFPFKVNIRVEYILREDKLISNIVATNLGDSKCPIGLCAHPYLYYCGSASIDECKIIVDGMSKENNSEFFTYSHNGEVTIDLENTCLDNCFKSSGEWKVCFEKKHFNKADSENNSLHKIFFASNSKFFHFYTGECVERTALAVEPCTTNAGVFGDVDKGDFIMPNESKYLSYAIWAE